MYYFTRNNRIKILFTVVPLTFNILRDLGRLESCCDFKENITTEHNCVTGWLPGSQSHRLDYCQLVVAPPWHHIVGPV